MARGRDDFALYADRGEKCPAGAERECNASCEINVDVMMLGFHVLAKRRDEINLTLHQDEHCTAAYEFVGKTGVVRVEVGYEDVLNRFRSDSHAFADMREFREGSRPAGVDEQPRVSVGKDVVVGRVIADINDIHDPKPPLN